MKHLLAVCLTIVFLGACNAPPVDADRDPAPDPDVSVQPTTTPEVDLGEVFSLTEGESVVFDDLGATLRFVEEANDSRCPSNVTCVWAGEVTARLEWTIGRRAPETVALTGHVGGDVAEDAKGVSAEVAGYRFTLLAMAPYPIDGEPGGTPVATLLVDQGE